VLETEDSIERIDGFNEILLHSLTRVVAKDSESVPKAKIETRLQILTILLSIVETQPDCIRSGMSELFETLKVNNYLKI
jgi:hypothetical protein